MKWCKNLGTAHTELVTNTFGFIVRFPNNDLIKKMNLDLFSENINLKKRKKSFRKLTSCESNALKQDF